MSNALENTQSLVEIARATRRSAERFSAAVARFGTEMPAHMDRFHIVMSEFRTTAERLNKASARA